MLPGGPETCPWTLQTRLLPANVNEVLPQLNNKISPFTLPAFHDHLPIVLLGDDVIA